MTSPPSSMRTRKSSFWKMYLIKCLMPGLDSMQNQESGSGQKVKMQQKLAGILINQRKRMAVFFYAKAKETWEGALDYCRTHYNDLASLSTKEKMDSALLEITQAETEYVWTGLRHLAGDWLWVTGDDLNYTAWYQNEQPQCPARELHCGALDKQTKLWTHRDCEEKLSFFCQYGVMKQTNL
uniref:C-type lectin domain-containing protein n=1 Tax=Cyprinus carpio carpio TaxID=630221 RepID=A0A8C1E5M1_CYPCA